MATDSGGPQDILANCRNGLLVDASDPGALAAGLKQALQDPRRWSEWSRNGLRGVKTFYTWEAHVARYLKAVGRILRKQQKTVRKQLALGGALGPSPFLYADRALICDLDQTLVGDPAALAAFLAWLKAHRTRVAFGVITGRRLESALWVLRRWGVAMPDVLISSVGSEIHYGPHWRADAGWENHIRQGWRRDAVARDAQRTAALPRMMALSLHAG